MICQHNDPPRVELTPHLPHYGKAICSMCGAFLRWLPKPDSDASKYRRPSAHRDLVAQFSRGFCELCLTVESELPGRQVLEAHHVAEFAEGGPATRENIWILCTGCARIIHTIRNYYRPNKAANHD